MRVTKLDIGMAVVAVAVIAMGSLAAASQSASAPPTVSSRLVSVQHFPSTEGDMCAWPPDPADASADLTAWFQEEDLVSALQRGRPASFLMASLQQPNLVTTLQQ